MKPQSRFNRVYIQIFSYSVVDGRYLRGLFNAFRKIMVEASYVHHGWGNSTLMIIVDIKTMTLSIEK
jgi:hypothetical protein